jgi:hypothetical protein
MVYMVEYSGYMYVEAKSAEEAQELYEEDGYFDKTESITSISKVNKGEWND